MELKNVILIVIAVLIILLVGIGLYVLDNGTGTDINNITSSLTNITDNNATNTTVVNNTNTTNATNMTVGDNSPRVNDTNNTNETYKVYNPQTDSYVPVIGEKYDDEVNRWYTYDSDGVRYYNTRIH